MTANYNQYTTDRGVRVTEYYGISLYVLEYKGVSVKLYSALSFMRNMTLVY